MFTDIGKKLKTVAQSLSGSGPRGRAEAMLFK